MCRLTVIWFRLLKLMILMSLKFAFQRLRKEIKLMLIRLAQYHHLVASHPRTNLPILILMVKIKHFLMLKLRHRTSKIRLEALFQNLTPFMKNSCPLKWSHLSLIIFRKEIRWLLSASNRAGIFSKHLMILRR
jgi:hypothetical protein